MTTKTSDLCDASEHVTACELTLSSYGLHGAFAGTIRTIRCFEDVDLIRQAVNEPGHGQVLVIDGGGSLRRALFGDVMAGLAVKNGWSGLVINGAIRDVLEINSMPLGVKALGTTPRRGERTGAGERDVLVAFGQVTFLPGSRLVADADGVVVLPPTWRETDIAVEDTVAQTIAYVQASNSAS